MKLHVSDYFEEVMKRQPNYEDIYYILEQIYDELLMDKENPIVRDWFADRLAARNLAPLSRTCHDNHSIVTECRHLIRDVVWHSLTRELKQIDYLDNLLSPLLSSGRLDIFSLNHDRVLDRYVTERERNYSDGFGMAENGVRYWNPCVFDRSENAVHLYKLHGAIDWFRLRPDGSQHGSIDWLHLRSEGRQLESERVGIPVNDDFRNTYASDGRLQDPVNDRPVFLAGTFNKMTDYTGDVFIDLHYRFISRLRHSRFLVVCGYSFGDKGINGHVLNWLMGRSDRKLIVIHKHPSEVRDGARSAVRSKWDELCKLRRILLVESWVEDLEPNALARLIG